MNNDIPGQIVKAESRLERDCLSLVLVILVWMWICAISFGRIFTEFVVSGINTQVPYWYSLVASLAQSVLIALPVWPLAWLWRNLRYRAILRTWALAILLGFLLVPARLPFPTEAQVQAIVHTLVCWLYIASLLIYWRYTRNRSPEASIGRGAFSWRSVWLALVIGACLALPWLVWGALGSILDTILEVTSGFSFGVAVALTIESVLLKGLQENSSGPIRDSIQAGFGTGTALLIVASATGFGYSGMQLMLMIYLPTLGWALAGLARMSEQDRARNAWLPMAILIGLSFSIPMSLIDADELALVISASPGEILGSAFYAALISLLIALLAGLGGVIWTFWSQKRLRSADLPILNQSTPPPAWRWGLAAAIAWVLAVLVYFSVGQPGFYGEGLFVILKDQADVTEAGQIRDYVERREYVYTTLVEHANTAQADLRKILDRWGIDYTPYYLVNGIQVQGGPLLRLWLLTRPEVDRVLDNPWMRPLHRKPPTNRGPFTMMPDAYLSNLGFINVPRVWEEFNVYGEGIVVGQSDSGVQFDHPNLAASYRGNQSQSPNLHDYNWYDPWYGTREPVDLSGHGTHTLGTIVGTNTGIAPKATWYACANLVRNLGNLALYLDCMQFMLAPFPLGGNPLTDGDPSKGAYVLNNSWGCPDIEGCDPEALHAGMRALRAAGLFVVASAGNDGPFCATLNTPPPIYEEVFAVGAIDSFGHLAFFSSIGPVTSDGSGRIKPDLVAPGVDVLSSMPGNTYGYNSGTSMAGPHVVGVVALIWSANPSLIGDIDRTTEILRQSARPYHGNLPSCSGATSYPSTAIGYGVLDAYEAVRLALQEK